MMEKTNIMSQGLLGSYEELGNLVLSLLFINRIQHHPWTQICCDFVELVTLEQVH